MKHVTLADILKDALKPVPWAELSPEEKGALLLAYHEGKTIQVYDGFQWSTLIATPCWRNDRAYRVKPEPVVEPVEINVKVSPLGFVGVSAWHTHKITFNLIDGEPDCSSVTMTKL